MARIGVEFRCAEPFILNPVGGVSFFNHQHRIAAAILSLQIFGGGYDLPTGRGHILPLFLLRRMAGRGRNKNGG